MLCIKETLLTYLHYFYEKTSRFRIFRKRELWSMLDDYIRHSSFTGCGFSDYWTLYSYVKKHRPAEILECGTGVSTVVLAHALMENEKEGYGRWLITSMEDQREWFEAADRLLPNHLRPYVDLVYSQKREFCHSIFRGVGYNNLPARPYDFVFVDGPGTRAPSDRTRSFDFDYINIVMKSEKGVFAIVDMRLGTVYVYQKLFGLEKVRYDPKRRLSYIGPCTKSDLRKEISIDSFFKSIRFFGRTELSLHMIK